eukprot:6173756-Pleurochrysis_carterae.AAC.1
MLTTSCIWICQNPVYFNNSVDQSFKVELRDKSEDKKEKQARIRQAPTQDMLNSLKLLETLIIVVGHNVQH